MDLLTTGVMGQKCAKVDHLRLKTMGGKKPSEARYAQQVPMIILVRPHDMLRNFIHLKKAQAHAPAGDPADFLHRLLQTGQ